MTISNWEEAILILRTADWGVPFITDDNLGDIPEAANFLKSKASLLIKDDGFCAAFRELKQQIIEGRKELFISNMEGALDREEAAFQWNSQSEQKRSLASNLPFALDSMGRSNETNGTHIRGQVAIALTTVEQKIDAPSLHR